MMHSRSWMSLVISTPMCKNSPNATCIVIIPLITVWYDEHNYCSLTQSLYTKIPFLGVRGTRSCIRLHGMGVLESDSNFGLPSNKGQHFESIGTLDLHIESSTHLGLTTHLIGPLKTRRSNPTILIVPQISILTTSIETVKVSLSGEPFKKSWKSG